jgi:hypothetical protein
MSHDRSGTCTLFEVTMGRPSFIAAWGAFTEVNISVALVGKKIGGNVEKNVAAHIFQNACPLRMSYVLNESGFPIAKGVGYEVVSGADKRLYLFRVNDMMDYLTRVFGKPDKTVKLPKPEDFSAMKGIIVVKGHGWSNARGHVTLWDGARCSDTCHLTSDPDNGPFIPETAALWALL